MAGEVSYFDQNGKNEFLPTLPKKVWGAIFFEARYDYFETNDPKGVHLFIIPRSEGDAESG